MYLIDAIFVASLLMNVLTVAYFVSSKFRNLVEWLLKDVED